MRRQLPVDQHDHPTSLRAELAASLARFLRLTLGAAGSIVALWLLSSLLTPGTASTAVVTQMVASTHTVQRTAAGAPMAAGGGKGKGRGATKQPTAATSGVSAAAVAKATLASRREHTKAVLAAKRAAMDKQQPLSQLTALLRVAKDNSTHTRQQLIDTTTIQRRQLTAIKSATRQQLKDIKAAEAVALKQPGTAAARMLVRERFTDLRTAVGAKGYQLRQAVAAGNGAIRRRIAATGTAVQDLVSALIKKARQNLSTAAAAGGGTQAPAEPPSAVPTSDTAAGQTPAEPDTTSGSNGRQSAGADPQAAQLTAAQQAVQNVGAALPSFLTKVREAIRELLGQVNVALQNFARHDVPGGTHTD